MSEAVKLLLSSFVVVIGCLGIPLVYLFYRAWKIAKLRMYLEEEKEGMGERDVRR
jgi:hypothetical protein